MCRPESSSSYLGVAMCPGERRMTRRAIALTTVSTKSGGDIREAGWLPWHPCIRQRLPGPKSNATDGARCFLASSKGTHHGVMPQAIMRVQRGIMRVGDARMASGPVMSRGHTGSRHQETPTHSRNNVFGPRKCWAFSPAEKPTRFPETSGSCQGGTGKGKGVLVANQHPKSAAT